MKYIYKQKHKNTCGPTAIVNVCRKLGIKISYKKALRLCGGLKKVNKRGMTSVHMRKVLRDMGLEVTVVHATLKEAKYFTKFDNMAVMVVFATGNRSRVDGHVVTLTKRGKALNMNHKLGQRHWTHTRRLWGFSPLVFIIRKHQ